MYLINLETGGNQAYIFASNKLRNIIGASEILYRVGTDYVERALKEVSGRIFSVKEIVDEAPIEKENSPDFEVIIATSGKALLLAKDRENAKKFIEQWSGIVAAEAPGVDAVAVCSETSFDVSASIEDFMTVFRETEIQMTLLRMKEGASLMRFQRLPITAECVYSGLPASYIEDGQGISEVSYAQRAAATDNKIKARMKALFPGNASEKILSGFESLEKLDWLAVIHADGNGLGQFFINLKNNVKKIAGEKATGRDYINYYRKFSSALDTISWAAFNKTVWEIWGQNTPQIVPIVVGGDDLTVVMDGYESLKFAEKFMDNFCDATEDNPDTQEILNASGMIRLGMCAGISIAKPHFPFSQSYDIAEKLMKNAKLGKNQYGSSVIAMDFHILYDSVVTSLSDIREKMKFNDRKLTAKPYVIYKQGNNPPQDEEWSKTHNYSVFQEAVEAIKKLPPSQAHNVRENLFSKLMETQEAEWQFLLSSYPEFQRAWRNAQEDRHLYNEIGEGQYDTMFLDALEMKKFLDDKNTED